MQVLKTTKGFELVLFAPEVFILRQALQQICGIYRAKPEELPDALRTLWHEAAPGMDENDIELWEQEAQAFRGENLQLAERLLQRIDANKQVPADLPITRHELETLVTLVNDHRLYLAALHGIDENTMATPVDEIKSLPSKMVLMQIHFLGGMMELMLLRLSGE